MVSAGVREPVGVKVAHCPVAPEQLAFNTGTPPAGHAPPLGGPQNGPSWQQSFEPGVGVVVAVPLNDGVAVLVSCPVGVIVGVPLGVGEAAGTARSATMAVVSAMLTRPSPLTSAVSHVLGSPKMMASTASMSASSTRPSQFASPCCGVLDWATPLTADIHMTSSAAQRHRTP